MPVLFLDQSTLQISVRCKTDETFNPSEEDKKKLKEIEKAAEQVRGEYKKAMDSLNDLINKCKEWNNSILVSPEVEKQ